MLDIVNFWDHIFDVSVGEAVVDLLKVAITFLILGCLLYWIIMFAARAGVLRAHDQLEKERNENRELPTPPAPSQP